uniref:Leucine rich repeat flightless interacting n=1 Tax=Echinococcus canadensis TaxID=519352 RepID=A0A915EY10_9CEST
MLTLDTGFQTMSSGMHNTRTGISDMVRTAQEGEIKRAATLKMSAEARLLRHQELERIRKQEEEEYTDDSNHVRGHNGSQTSSSRYSSRHSSIEPSYTSSAYGNDPRELKRLLLQLEEKYKEVLVINAQLDCEKQFLTYSVDLLKDKLEDATESNQYNQKCAADRKKELAYQRMQLVELNHQLEVARQQIAIRDELIAERGLVLVSANGSEGRAGMANGDTGQSLLNGAAVSEISHPSVTLQPSLQALSSNAAPLTASASSYTILSKSNAEALKSICGSDIDAKIASLLEERAKDKECIETLKLHLAEERERIELVQKLDTRAKGGDPENLRQAVQAARSQAQDYKFRLEQANQKITGLEGDIIRLEGQVKRFKTIAESAEMQEDQMKQERRKIHRELREALSTIDDLKSENSTLQRKIDKLSRSPPGVPSGSGLRSYRGSSQARQRTPLAFSPTQPHADSPIHLTSSFQTHFRSMATQPPRSTRSLSPICLFYLRLVNTTQKCRCDV